MMFQMPRDRASVKRVVLAQRPLHRAYGALSVLFVVALSAIVVVGVIQAAPATAQFGVGWFDNAGKSGTAFQQVGNDSPVQASAGPDQIGFERQLFAQINKARIEKGLPPLRLNETLTRAARAQSKDMAQARKLDVTDSSGRTPVNRVEDSGYPQAQVVLETVGAGYTKPEQMLAALLENANTKNNLLSAEVNEIGVGYAYAKDDRTFRHYWSVDLGKRSGLAYTVVVNNGAENTTAQNVTLHIGGKGWAQQMKISNTPNFSGIDWENFSETKTWSVSEGTGPKKVYVRLRGPGEQETLAIGEIALVPAAKGAKPGPHANYAYAAPRPANVRVLAGDVSATGGTTAGGTVTLANAPSASSLAPSYYQTSEYMLGKVAVGIVMPQCDGAIDRCTETWSASAMDQVYAQTQAAMNWWAQRMGNKVSFVYDQRRAALTGYEPINHPQSDEGLWIGDTMSRMGFAGTSYFEQVYAYANWLRQNKSADWAFVVFAANSVNNASGTFSNGYFAYAYIPGPFMVVTYDNDGYGITNMGSVVAHEAGHMFGALDQYSGAGVGCSSPSGYLQIQNQNSQLSCQANVDSIMRGGVAPYVNNQVDPFALGMLGYRVSSASGLPDPIDTKPAIVLGTVPSSVAGSATITGSAFDQPYTPPTGDSITINNIASVQYRVNGGAWQNATPADGSATFNKVSQPFSFTAALSAGANNIEIRATNRVNNVSDSASVTVNSTSGSTTTTNPTATPAQATPVPPTATAVPPTATRVPPTATSVPPTATRVPPTATPISLSQPTATPVTLAQPTATPPATGSSGGSGSLAISVNAGTTALSLPYTFYTASTLIAAINGQGGTVYEVNKWNGRNWQAYVPGAGGSDFQIAGGEAYFVKSKSASIFIAAAKAGTSPATVRVDKGWDMLGVPACKDGSQSCYTASSLAAAVNAQGGGIAEIDRWQNGSWSAFLVGYTFNDYPIIVGQGYFIRTTKASNWTP